jgi:2-keto-4-pentenoate hydratase/2-oxohepta-3-ene-1,7-dioic acid hydratase in catechol pathway
MFSLRTALVLALVGWSGLLPAARSATAEDGKVVKYVRFHTADSKRPTFGIVEGDRVRVLAGKQFGKWKQTDRTVALADITILPPSNPSKVIALAGNYKDHLGDKPLPKNPEPFYKIPSCIQRHEGKIVLPTTTDDVHYEAEVVVVIGKRAKNVPVDKALDYVLGITCGNDVSARTWQRNDTQWWRAKASDTFGPCGPYIVAGLDYGNLGMALRLNGEVRQKTNTTNLIHDIATTVSFISEHVTLRPGDLIFTGTPGKTKPIKPGDVVEVEIEGVGVLRNPVVAGK